MAALAVCLPGCGDGEEGETTGSEIAAVTCRLQQQIGDTDCDGTVDADADHDGIVDFIDRYPSGYDFGDDDGDGFANWADSDPESPRYTVSELIANPAAGELEVHEELERGAAVLARENSEIKFILDEMERETERRESQDTDSDGTSDFYDPQPDLHSLGDEDDDGVSNHRDHFPLSDDYE